MTTVAAILLLTLLLPDISASGGAMGLRVVRKGKWDLLSGYVTKMEGLNGGIR